MVGSVAAGRVGRRPLRLRCLLDELPYRLAWLSASLYPAFRDVLLEGDPRRVEGRIVGADLIDEAPVAGRARVGDDDSVKRPFLGAVAAQSDYQCHSFLP